MKKLLVLILVFCILPLPVFARQETKERLLETIAEVKNIQVEEDTIILSTTVQDNQITFQLEKDGEKIEKEISYFFDGVCFTFSSGYVENNQLLNNEQAFYLYSILESLSTASYDENHYYNSSWIMKKVLEMKTNNQLETTSHNIGKTFGIHLKNIDNEIQIEYQYYLDGEDTILVNRIVEARQNEILTNPETGSYSFFITILLFLVIGLAAYTYWNPGKREE